MYYLHDSVVSWLRYSAKDEQLVIQIELSNWMQAWFMDGDQEQIPGRLIFSGVRQVESNLDLKTFAESREYLSGRVLDADYVPDNDRDELEAGKITVSWFDHRSQTEKIMIIEFLAANVEWNPC